jgi:hypothetical protein
MRHIARALVVISAGVAAAGCSTGSLLGSSDQASPANTTTSGTRTSFTDRMSAFFLGNPAQPGAGVAGPSPDLDCPTMDIRSGASTYSVAAPGSEPNATNLRYQATIARASRECAVLGATLTIKVGIQGRVLLGPAGGPGQVDVPIRLALVKEGMQPRTIWTKFYRVPVTIPPGQTNVSFVHIEEDLTVPVPSAADLESYIIYIGFDPAAAGQPERKKPPAKPKKPVASR